MKITARAPLEDGSGTVQRSHWLEGERLRVYPWIMLGPYAIGQAIWWAWSLPSLVDRAGGPLGNDFIEFWSAARLAVEGRPAATYDPQAIYAVQHAAVAGLGKMTILPWHYPPPFLLVVYPLGWLPYIPALGVFLLASLAFWAALIRGMFADRRAWAPAAAFAAGLCNLSAGQNGFVTGGLAGFALLALERRPAVAGALIGLLAIKPHLAVLFPLALIAGGHWRAFAVAAATAAGLTCMSIAAFGWLTFMAFLHDLPSVRLLAEEGRHLWGSVPSAYVFCLSLGLGRPVAIALQAMTAVAAAICVWRAWRSPAAPYEAKAATLAVASLLVSPYVFDYDLVWTGVAMAWLVRLGLRAGFLKAERELLLAASVSPFVMSPIHRFTGVQIGFPMLLALLVLAVSRCRAIPNPDGKLSRCTAHGVEALSTVPIGEM